MSTKATGVLSGQVKWFDAKKGYGFITRDDGEPDVYVHYTGLDGEGYKQVKDNELVRFEVEQGKKGPKAINVRVLRKA